ncbi:MAG TPA: site-specific DNA-methyltransferase [Candidatus Kapabacteria bacterium]
MARLEFAGARYVRNYHLAVPHHELDIDKKKSPSTSPSLDDNLIIHGDNLKALKALLPHYAGKVKCIYIDPPYNTGNENWVYNDNVNSPRHKEWLGKVVDKDCQDRHDRWLSMMTPRLKLLKELLRDDGVIFISIDDNEVHRLRMLMDEIFGEYGYLASFVWRRRISSSLASSWISSDHEYLLAYAKNPEQVSVKGDERDMSKYNIPDGKGGFYASMPLTVGMTKEMRPNQWYDLINPKTRTKYLPPDGRIWGYYPPTMAEKIKEGKIIWPEDFPDRNLTSPRLKSYAEDSKRDRKPISTWISEVNGKNGSNEEDVYVLSTAKNEEGTRIIKEIFKGESFAYPKPLSLVKTIVDQFTAKDDIVLDSFAGSGTTAHAVLALNIEDGGNRKFILVEQEDYADTITAERVRRVIKGIKGAKDESLKKGLGGSFSYLTLGEEYDVAKILSGKSLPKYEDMASYVFQTATGETLDRKKIEKKKNYIGSSKFYDVYLFYEPDVEKLKSSDCALKLDFVEAFKGKGKKKRLVFGAVRYVNQETMNNYDVEFCQLPYEVYRRIEDAA